MNLPDIIESLPSWVLSNVFLKAKLKDGSSSQTFDPNYNDERKESSIQDANLVTSIVSAKYNMHTVMLDIDLPAKLIPSSTPGHYHLYIDKTLHEDDYGTLLRALNKAGIIQDGIVGQFETHGCTSLRLPHIKKGKEVTNIPEGGSK